VTFLLLLFSLFRSITFMTINDKKRKYAIDLFVQKCNIFFISELDLCFWCFQFSDKTPWLIMISYTTTVE